MRQPPRRGHLAGVVVDKATGEPLPHANVLLADANTGTATNKAGFYSFSSLLSGPHRIVATYVGYETTVDSVWVPPGDSVQQRIALRPQSVAAAPVVVNSLQQRLPSRRLGKGVLPAGHLAQLGSIGVPDVARGTGSLLGVALQPPLADLHIQGGATGEHQTRLDGVPIRSPVTMGRLLGAFSPLALGRLTVYKAGFRTEQGSLTSGVVAPSITWPPRRTVWRPRRRLIRSASMGACVPNGLAPSPARSCSPLARDWERPIGRPSSITCFNAGTPLTRCLLPSGSVRPLPCR